MNKKQRRELQQLPRSSQNESPKTRPTTKPHDEGQKPLAIDPGQNIEPAAGPSVSKSDGERMSSKQRRKLRRLRRSLKNQSAQAQPTTKPHDEGQKPLAIDPGQNIEPAASPSVSKPDGQRMSSKQRRKLRQLRRRSKIQSAKDQPTTKPHDEGQKPLAIGPGQNVEPAAVPRVSKPDAQQQQQLDPRQIVEQRFLSEDLEELTPANANGDLINELATWKREAKFEDNDRYFCHVDEVDQLAHGYKCFVIGRKGSGKSAICEYFNRLQRFDTFSEKLTFKSFPFNLLYAHTNDQYRPPNQFISIWKYVIYSTVCRLMIKNHSVDAVVREGLSTLYGDATSLSRRVDRWVQKEFGLSLLGLSSKFAKEREAPPDSWLDSINFLEDLVLKHAGGATYFVLFDELDEDYHDILAQNQHQQYMALITSLFKAVQDVRAVCGSSGISLRIHPIIFLRDDIFDLIYDNDKTKWGDFVVDLGWDVRRIKKVTAFRISRALDSGCEEILDFEPAWQRVFGIARVRKGLTIVKTFDYIARATLLRPRDFVAYLQHCAQLARDEGAAMSTGIVRRADKAFSNYLRGELTDELGSMLPDIRGIFDVISQLRKPFFSAGEFQSAYQEHVNRGEVIERNVQSVLQALFAFSVLGNKTRGGPYIFRYENREARFNFNETIVVHRGLLKSLQVF